MKTILKYFAVAFLAIGAVSCEEGDDVIKTGNTSGQTLIDFGAETYELPVVIDATGTSMLTFDVSTLSNEDRTYNITVDMDNTTAIAGSYTIPSSVTIPAGSYNAELEIQGTDVAGVDTEQLNIRLNITEGDSYVVGGVADVKIFQICPVPDTFMIGDYTITDLAGVIGPGNSTENFESGTVTLSASSATGRSFSVAMLPGFRPTPGDVTINLICGDFILAETGPNPGIGCSAADIRFGAATTPTSYPLDFSDDSLFIITYDEDILGSCGGPFPDQSFLLQKI